MKKKASGSSPRLTSWQVLALGQLREVAAERPEALTIVRQESVLARGCAWVPIRLPTGDLPREPNGLQLQEQEEFQIGIPGAPLVPPWVEVKHARFVGYPHVLQGRRLCIYLDPAREWSPADGMVGFLDRLWTWLGDAAASRFDASSALYHAVGGVLHRSDGTPTIVVREEVARMRSTQRAWLARRTDERLDLIFASPTGSSFALPVLSLSADLPLGAGVTFGELLNIMDNPPVGTSRSHAGLGPVPSRAILTTLAASAVRNAAGSPQYFCLAVPHPAGGPRHLLVGRLPIAGADRLREHTKNHGPVVDIGPEAIAEDVPIEWCGVSDEREAVTTRRDVQRPVSAFKGKDVHVWGCGGLGSWIAEFVVRAGAARITVCDPGSITGGLLVRQDYVEEDIGCNKADALSRRLQAISDRVEIRVETGGIPQDPEAAFAADIVIDATISVAVAQLLNALVLQGGSRRALLAEVATDVRTGTLGMLVVSAPADEEAPIEVDRRTGEMALSDASLESYHSFWQEPLDGQEIIPTRGCSVPTFHGSAADLAAVAACLVSLMGTQLSEPASGTHLVGLPHSGASRHYAFIKA